MRRIRKRVIRFAAARLVIVFRVVCLAVILSQPALTAERSGSQTRTKQTRGAGNPLIELGRFPPDFELPKLTFSTDAAGKPIGLSREKARLLNHVQLHVTSFHVPCSGH
ncbi:MAG: hypothetical protein WBC05_17175 [Sedimentisphaerales bacterium]